MPAVTVATIATARSFVRSAWAIDIVVALPGEPEGVGDPDGVGVGAAAWRTRSARSRAQIR